MAPSTRPTLHRAVGALAAGVAVTTLAGCGSGNDDAPAPASKAVPAAQVADTIATKLTAKVGRAPESVTCPSDLPSRKGATMTCLLNADGGENRVIVTVGDVGEDAATRFTFSVLPRTAVGVDAATVAATITSKLVEKTGQRPEKVSCPRDLPASKGAVITCVLTAADGDLDVKVTVTSVGADDRTEFDFEVLKPAKP